MALDDYTPDSNGSGNRGGDFFKPANHETALAILVEPESFDSEANNPFFDPEDERSSRTRAEAVATLSVFENQGQIKDGDPTVIDNAVITNAKLAKDLGEANIGKSLLLTVEEQRFKSKKGSYKAWVWVPVEDKKIREAVGNYIETRDSAVAPWEA